MLDRIRKEGEMADSLGTAEKSTFSGHSDSVQRRRDAQSRIVVHTTETDRLPGDGDVGAAPHFTAGSAIPAR
jgi:hypothetical protein